MTEKTIKNFSVFRTAKLKTVSSVAGAVFHNTRAKPPLRADPDARNLNLNLIADRDDHEYFKNRISTMRKHKSAVLAHEFVMSFSPEMTKKLSREQQESYFRDCLNWVIKKHGNDSANVVSAIAHFDEKTPHVHIVVTPIVENKWSSKHILGGKSSHLSELQTDFHNECAKKYGLARGIVGSKADHVTIKEHARIVDDELPKLRDQIEKLTAQRNKLAAQRNKALSDCNQLKVFFEKQKKQIAELTELTELLKSDLKTAIKPYLERHGEYMQMLQESPFKAAFWKVSQAFRELPVSHQKIVKPLFEEIERVDTEITLPSRKIR